MSNHHCNEPACPIDGVAASNRDQSEFYRLNDRTIEARDCVIEFGNHDDHAECAGMLWGMDHDADLPDDRIFDKDYL